MYAEREHLLNPYASMDNIELQKIDEELDKKTRDLNEKLSCLINQHIKEGEILKTLKTENLGLNERVVKMERAIQNLAKRIALAEKRS